MLFIVVDFFFIQQDLPSTCRVLVLVLGSFTLVGEP